MMAIIAFIFYILGGIVTHIIDMSDQKKKPEIYIFEKYPEWAVTWMKHCDDNDLLYDTGLPIYADNKKIQIYKDAIEKEFIEDIRGLGYEVVERD